MSIEENYEKAKKEYEELGVDVEAALERVKNIPISVHCWQGDDVLGLEGCTSLDGGIQTTGNYMGKARNKEELFEDMQKAHICLMALKRSNSKEQYPKNVRRLIFRLRRRVETVFSQLSEQLHAERVLAKSMRGLKTRLVNKILAYDLCMVINHLFGKTYDIQKIKQLIF